MIKHTKKLITALIGAALLLAAMPAYANEVVNKEYASVSGTITQVMEYEAGTPHLEGQFLVLVENEDGTLMNFLIAEDTYLFTEHKPEIGKQAIGFYDNTGIAIMIYPPQMKAVAFGVSLDESQTVCAGLFDDNLVNEDNSLKLNIGDDTQIINIDGSKYDGEIRNKNLAVVYTFATMSIPAQTTPQKVVVLPDKDKGWTGGTGQHSSGASGTNDVVLVPEGENVSDTIINLEGISIDVNGSSVENASAYIANGIVMVPLRAAAEALGYTVGWDSTNKSISLDNTMTMYIGRDYYVFGRMAPIELGTAPQLRNGTTFVPLTFFSDVAKINKAALNGTTVELARD